MADGVSVLIVDDNALNLKLTSLLLRQAGFEVETATDAAEAIEKFHACSPRLVLMDLQLPGMDGYALTAHIKRQPGASAVTIVALTAYAMIGDEQRARDAGCDGYITKPIDTRTLVDDLRRILAGEGPSGNPVPPPFVSGA